MAVFRVLLLLGLASTSAGIQVENDPQSISHNLTVCNAYADAKPLSVYALNAKARLTEEPLEYKSCKTLVVELGNEERVDFKLGGLSVGTFHASSLPFVPSTLLLVPYHRGNGTMSATFASHTFSADSSSTQAVVIDAYAGSTAYSLKIKVGAKKSQRNSQTAELKAGNAVSLLAGSYEIIMESGKTKQTVPMNAGEGSKFAVIRMGSESDNKPQELLVAPMAVDTLAAKSGSLHVSPGVLAVASAMLASLFAALA